MRGSREMALILCASLSSVGLASIASCSETRPPAPATPAPSADSISSAAPASAPAPRASEPPAESGLAIKRGIAMLAQDRTTFRPCGENVELWVVDQTDGVLRQTFATEVQNTPAMLYIEAYGERAPLADEDPAEARAYAGTFVLEEVLYAGPQPEVRGCDAPAPEYVVAARGNEPFWSAEVGEARVLWRQPGTPAEIDLGTPQTQDAEGAAHYRASGDGHQLELLIDLQACRDSMSGEYFAYAAKAVFDGKELTGCARVGGK
jgi:uncharacterized membrane protein